MPGDKAVSYHNSLIKCSVFPLLWFCLSASVSKASILTDIFPPTCLSFSKTLDDVRLKLENFDQKIGVQIIQNALKVMRPSSYLSFVDCAMNLK